MDRVTPGHSQGEFHLLRPVIFWVLILAVTGVMAYKAIDEGWFEPREPLDFSEAPVLVFFNRHKGCECEMVVYEAAERQIQNWPAEARRGIRILHVDLDRRPDLGKQFDIIRAPAIFLVNQDGQVVYEQKESLSDFAPLNLPAFETAIQELHSGN